MKHISEVLKEMTSQVHRNSRSQTRQLLEQIGINSSIAERLMTTYSDDAIIDAIDNFGKKYGPGGIVKALREGWKIEPFERKFDPPSERQVRGHGFVYFMTRERDVEQYERGECTIVKIGRTKMPESRLKGLMADTGEPCVFVRIIEEMNDHWQMEEDLHVKFHSSRLDGEWFVLYKNEVDDALTGLVTRGEDVTSVQEDENG